MRWFMSNDASIVRRWPKPKIQAVNHDVIDSPYLIGILLLLFLLFPNLSTNKA
jgi:hypothetical protein